MILDSYMTLCDTMHQYLCIPLHTFSILHCLISSMSLSATTFNYFATCIRAEAWQWTPHRALPRWYIPHRLRQNEHRYLVGVLRIFATHTVVQYSLHQISDRCSPFQFRVRKGCPIRCPLTGRRRLCKDGLLFLDLLAWSFALTKVYTSG